MLEIGLVSLLEGYEVQEGNITVKQLGGTHGIVNLLVMLIMSLWLAGYQNMLIIHERRP